MKLSSLRSPLHIIISHIGGAGFLAGMGGSWLQEKYAMETAISIELAGGSMCSSVKSDP